MQVRYLIAPGTIDDAMWPLLGKKLQVVGKALDGNATGSATGIAIATVPCLFSTTFDLGKSVQWLGSC